MHVKCHLFCITLLFFPVLGNATSDACFAAIYALKEGRLDEAIELYTRCIEDGELDTASLVVVYNDRGNAYGRQGMYQKALADFNRVLELDGRDADGFYNRGLTQAKLGRNETAIDDYSASIQLKPGYTKAYINRGNTLGRLGQFRLAIDDFNQAIKLEPATATGYYNRGLAYYSQGYFGLAVEDLLMAIELQPEYYKALENLAWLLATCPEGKYRDGEQAIKLAKQAQFIDRENRSGLWEVLAAAYARTGRFDRARQYGEMAVQRTRKSRSIESLENRLKLYQAGESYTDPVTNRFLNNQGTEPTPEPAPEPTPELKDR